MSDKSVRSVWVTGLDCTGWTKFHTKQPDILYFMSIPDGHHAFSCLEGQTCCNCGWWSSLAWDNAPVTVCWANSVCFVFTWSIIWYGYIALKETSLPPLFLWGFRTVSLKKRCKITVCLGCHLLTAATVWFWSKLFSFVMVVCLQTGTQLWFLFIFFLQQASVSLCVVIVEQFGQYL